MNWWLDLTILEHILFAIALASSLVIIAKAILIAMKFYQMDKLNSEPEELENYEAIANNDSDIEKHVPGFVSVMSMNVFLASGSWSFFLFGLFLPSLWAILCGVLFGIVVLFVYGMLDHYNKKRKNKSFQNAKNN